MSIFRPLNKNARPLGADDPNVIPIDPSELNPSEFNSVPWLQYNAAVAQLQPILNQYLSQRGFCPLTVDGKLGPATCGAFGAIGAKAPSSCKGFTAPKLVSSGCSPMPAPATIPKPTAAASVVPASTLAKPATSNLVLVGGAAIVAVGVLYFLLKKS